jgi:hypothetical protein
MLVVQHHPDRPLTQLGRVSPMSCHSSILSRIGASTRPGVIHFSDFFRDWMVFAPNLSDPLDMLWSWDGRTPLMMRSSGGSVISSG